MDQYQQAAFYSVQDGANVFLTGAAGSGKSFLLSHIISWAKESGKEIGITASTGCAAYLINGRTIHSFLGIGLAKKTAEELADFVRNKKKYVVTKLLKLSILLLDEISMIDESLLTKISLFLQLIRKCELPFGGIQVVLSGDFAQIGPVNGRYCFHSSEWKRACIETKTLQIIHRQNNDDRFREILQELRWGMCSKDSIAVLKKLKNTKFDFGIRPTMLFATNADVDTINKTNFEELLSLGAQKQTYKSTYANNNSKIWSDCMKVQETLEICVGAQVMVTWNMNPEIGIVNGSRGIVTECTTTGPKVKFVSGLELLIEPVKVCEDELYGNEQNWVSFIPLKLAWAVTVHKSQGMTLDAVVLDLGQSIFEYGQAYTALSRARNLASIKITSIKQSSFKTHKDVVAFYKASEALLSRSGS